MLADLQGVVLIAWPVLAVGLVLALRRSPWGWRDTAAGGLLAILLWMLGGIVAGWAVGCMQCCGAPGYQSIILPLTLLLVLGGVRLAAVRAGFTVASIALMLLLLVQFGTLVHTERYIGLQGNTRTDQAVQAANLRSLRQAMLETGASNTASFPAGWFAGSAAQQALFGEDVRPGDLTQFDVRVIAGDPLWHSPLTSLYTKRTTRMAVWYPGGTLRDAADRLEYRPYP